MTNTKKMCRIALIAALEFAVFYSLSNILYVEAITLLIVSVALSMDKKDAILSSLIFGFILVMYMGLTPWTIMYLCIYPFYSWVVSLFKNRLLNNGILLILSGFILSAATGMILDIPFILVSKTVTFLYILTGIKTSLIQGVITAIEFSLLFDSLHKVLLKINK